MRLFVAVDVGADVQGVAARVVDALKGRAGRIAPRARVNWVKPDRLHLTIRFIGEVEQATGQRILEALTPPLTTPAFDLTIAGMGTFPPGRPPRVVWAGITNGLESAQALEREVRSRLDPLASSDDRPYQPHLTLGRVKHAAGLRPASLLEGVEDTLFGVVHVEAVTLFESRLSSAEPTYVALGRASLRLA